MRKRPAKRLVTVALCVITVVVLGGLQPLFFGVQTFFGINALTILLPLSGVFMVVTGLHLYQTWPRVRVWFKRNPDKAKQRDKLQRMTVVIAFVLILAYDIASAWYYALSVGIASLPLGSIRVWSWVATALLVVHVAQRWRLTVSYFRPAVVSCKIQAARQQH